MSRKLTTTPTWLRGEALTEWKRVAGSLARSGILDWADRDMLAIYCDVWAKLRRVNAQLDKEGMVLKAKTGRLITHPLAKDYYRLSAKLVSLGSKLGMTPLGRARLRAAQIKMPRLRIAKR